VRIPVYQGESVRAADNFLLGEVVLEGCARLPRRDEDSP
jgi:molecular chaperone DnaK (HSP70)